MKVHLAALGCKLNQNEMEELARQLATAGHLVVSSAGDADAIVLNTCTVTKTASGKSRQLARRLHRANSEAPLFLTGCFAEMSPQEAAGLPGVHQVVGNQDKKCLADLLEACPAGTGSEIPPDRTHFPRLRTRASVKIQDGCDNECTYCVVRIARGPQRSRDKEEILAEVQARVGDGYQEIVLTGVHIGAYGRDQGQAVSTSLWDLVDEILRQTTIPRLRLSSIEPWDVTVQNLSLWQSGRLCRHLHLPLQSGCDAVLSRMKRRYTVREFARLVEAARRTVPGMAITTDVIVGFPGETEDQFLETLYFVEAMQFSKVHVFPYSDRPDTKAAGYANQIDPQTKRDRSRRLAAAARRSETARWDRFVGQTVDVLWEAQKRDGEWSGLTDNYVRVSTRATEDLHNRITPVLITGVTARGLRGRIIE